MKPSSFIFLFLFLSIINNGICNDNDDSKPSVDSPLFHEFPWTESEEEINMFHNKTLLINHPIGEVTSSELTSQIPLLTANNTSKTTDGVAQNVASSTLALQKQTLAASEKSVTSDDNVDLTTHGPLATDAHLSNYSTDAPKYVAVDQTLNNSKTTPALSKFAPAPVVLDRVSSPMAAATFLQPTESAAILAAVFISVALIGYIGLVVWRRILEKRYGNRELLVNEEFYDVNDLKYFEL